MKFCQSHWDMCRDAIKDRSMDGLVMKSSEAAIENEQKGEDREFDPLMSMNWFFMNEALKNGGPYLLGQNEDGSNEGHYCPVCEFERHSEGFVAQEIICGTADQMRAHCLEQRLIARPS